MSLENVPNPRKQPASRTLNYRYINLSHENLSDLRCALLCLIDISMISTAGAAIS